MRATRFLGVGGFVALCAGAACGNPSTPFDPDVSAEHVFATPGSSSGSGSEQASAGSANGPGSSSGASGGSALSTPTTADDSSDDAGSAGDASSAPAPPPAPQPKAEMFVHIHAYEPQWWALWIPSTAMLQNGQKDPPASVLSSAIAGGNWPPPSTFFAEPTVGGGYTETDGGYTTGGNGGDTPPRAGEDGGTGSSSGGSWTLTTNGQCGSSTTTCYVGEDYSPLIIDFAGRGLSLTVPNAGTRFDITGSGRKILISWPRDGVATSFLVYDRDHDGKIASIDEMFGNNTVGPDGKTAANGFDALAKYDANRDRVIDARDPIFRQLSVWRDNGDAVTQQGELVTLEEAGVERISLSYVDKTERADVFGNESRERSVARLASGEWARVFDVWFVPGFERR
jgi:hypothetical protein